MCESLRIEYQTFSKGYFLSENLTKYFKFFKSKLNYLPKYETAQHELLDMTVVHKIANHCFVHFYAQLADFTKFADLSELVDFALPC